VDVVEPLGSALEASKLFSEENRNALSDRRVRVNIADPRQFLRSSSKYYDVVIARPPHPASFSSGPLFTSEFFELVDSRLSDGGIFCQWLPLYKLPPADLASLLATFQKTFQYVMIWKPGVDFHILLIGSKHPVAMRKKVLESALAEPEVRQDLSKFSDVRSRHFHHGLLWVRMKSGRSR